MRTIHIIDTSVYLVILQVPNHYTDQQLEQTVEQLDRYYNNNDKLFLPFGTIIEASSHIADSINGRRHALISKFVDDVESAIQKQTPYTLCGIPKGNKADNQILQWIKTYKAFAPTGLSLVDSMSVDIFNEMTAMFPYDRVRIWNYDKDHLSGYDSSLSGS